MKLIKGLWKTICITLFILLLSIFLSACKTEAIFHPISTVNKDHQDEAHYIVFNDSLGNEVKLESKPERVVSLLGSFTDIWQLAGGTVIGATNDVQERGIIVPQDVTMVGTGHSPNLEIILSLKPDFVILSADYSNHLELFRIFKENNISVGLFSVELFSDYLTTLKTFTDITSQSHLYESNGLNVKKRIDDICQKVNVDKKPAILLIRAYSKGANAKGEDDMTGNILKELGTENIASQENGLFQELSMEIIIDKDPDFIFVTVMGSDTEKALDRLKKDVQSNPAWNNLSAVKKDRYIVLPKELFHYKPNLRWDEAYEYLMEILYGE